jgi:phosphotransferase system HPr-like phosphotransfer protein
MACTKGTPVAIKAAGEDAEAALAALALLIADKFGEE